MNLFYEDFLTTQFDEAHKTPFSVRRANWTKSLKMLVQIKYFILFVLLSVKSFEFGQTKTETEKFA